MNFITRKLLPLFLLSSIIGGSINAMHQQTTSSRNMSKQELMLGIQELPREIIQYIIYLLLQNSIFDLQLYKTIPLGRNPSSAAFSADGEHFWCLFPNFEIQLWNTEAGNILQRLSIEGANCFRTAALSPDGKRIAIAMRDYSVRVYEFKTGEFIKVSPEHTANIMAIAFSPDGEKILTGSWDKTARICDSKTGKLVTTLQGHAFYISSVTFSPDGEKILTGSADNTARLWNSTTGEFHTTFTKHTQTVTSAAFSPNGEDCITGSSVGEIFIWNATTGKLLKTFIHPDSQISSVAFSLNEDTVFATSAGKAARVWSSITGELLIENTTDSNDLNCCPVVLSPEGRICLIIALNKTAYVWKRSYDFNCLTPEKKERAFKQLLTLLPLLEKPSSSSDDSSKNLQQANSTVTVKIENQLLEEHSTNQQHYIRP